MPGKDGDCEVRLSEDSGHLANKKRKLGLLTNEKRVLRALTNQKRVLPC